MFVLAWSSSHEYWVTLVYIRSLSARKYWPEAGRVVHVVDMFLSGASWIVCY